MQWPDPAHPPAALPSADDASVAEPAADGSPVCHAVHLPVTRGLSGRLKLINLLSYSDFIGIDGVERRRGKGAATDMQTTVRQTNLILTVSIALLALLGVLTGSGVASASAPADPPGGAVPLAPHFYNGNVEGIRAAGSDTTLFLMQRIGDLYSGAGLYGCSLNSSAGQTLYNTSDPASTTSNEEFFCQSGQNLSTTDVNDNWDHTEVYQGLDDIGSSPGQSQLCGALSTPLNVDFVRSAKPAGSACSTLAELGFAKDGVPVLAYTVNPTTIGAGTSTTAPYSSVNAGVVGPVSEGWLPGDPNGGPYTGTALANISDADNGGGAASTAYRLWCATNSTRITDWGALTNLGPDLEIQGVSTTGGSTTATITGTFPSTVASPDAITGPDIPSGTTVSSVSGGTLTLSNPASATATTTVRIATSSSLAVGQGSPIGVPVRIMGINTGSGVESTFASYAESGVASGGCSSNMNTNAASDPNPVTATGTNATPHIALQNNSDQIDEFAAGDFPSPDYVDQAIEAATTLYVESDGVYNTNPYAAAVTIDGTSYAGSKVAENGFTPTTGNVLQNKYPTAITLFNVYRTDTVRASAGGFLNWICDGDTNFEKGIDNSTGLNFDAELSTLISSVFGFPRLTDLSAAPAISTPPDGVPAPNNSCAATLLVTTTSGSDTITLTAGGSFPVDIVNGGGLVGSGSVGITSSDFPAGTTVVSGGGTSTLTLSNSATGTGTSVSTVFSGVPGVTSVAGSQN